MHMSGQFKWGRVLVALILAIGSSTRAAAPYLPVPATGYNKGVVVEATATNIQNALTAAFDSGSGSTSGYTWFQTGFRLPDGTVPTGGLPAVNGPIFYTDSSGVQNQFQLQSYTSNNALMLYPVSTSGTLTFAQPDFYSKLSVLTASTFGNYSATMTLHFTDGSSSQPLGFTAEDWWAQPSDTRVEPVATPHVLGVSYLVNPFSVAEMYDTAFDFTGTSNATKKISSLTFSYSPTANGGRGGNLGVFAVSGVPEPSAIGVMMFAAIFGLGRRLRRPA
jgi:hypothetical protein